MKGCISNVFCCTFYLKFFFFFVARPLGQGFCAQRRESCLGSEQLCTKITFPLPLLPTGFDKDTDQHFYNVTLQSSLDCIPNPPSTPPELITTAIYTQFGREVWKYCSILNVMLRGSIYFWNSFCFFLCNFLKEQSDNK